MGKGLRWTKERGWIGKPAYGPESDDPIAHEPIAETELCRAVIMLAMADVGFSRLRGEWDESLRLYTSGEAQDLTKLWFRSPSVEPFSFRWCCEACRVDPDRVLRTIHPHIKLSNNLEPEATDGRRDA